MSILEILYIANIVFLCAFSTFTDLKNAVIKNKVLLVSLAVSVVLDLGYYPGSAREFLPMYLSNFFVLSCISIMMYAMGLWAAGDSKLLIAVAASLPGRFLDAGTRGGMAPGIFIIVITFSVAFLYVIADSFLERIHDKNRKRPKILSHSIKSFMKGYLINYIYISSANLLIEVILPAVYEENVVIVYMIDMLLAVFISEKQFFNRRNVLITCGGVSAGGMIYHLIRYGFILPDLRIYLYLAIIILVRVFSEEYAYEMIPTSEIKKGMILSQNTVIMMMPSRIKGLPAVTTEDVRSRISEEEAESIRRWENSSYGLKEIEIVRKIPFAIFISIGTLIFLLTRLGVI